MPKIKVLLAEDHTIVRKGIKELLDTQEGIEVIGEAVDGREAIEKVKQIVPDVIVIDIKMPNINGIEATRQIKKINPEIKVLALSAHDNEEYIRQIFKAGASGYLLKESAVSDLVSAVNAVEKGDMYLSPLVSRAIVKDYIGHVGAKSGDSDSLSILTDREREVLKLIAEGNTSKKIARMLKLSANTVDVHRANLMEKLDIHDITSLIKYSIKKGLIDV